MGQRIINVFEEFKKKEVGHDLSGIALIVDGHILLVKPRKYDNQAGKWSIPKGHIEGDPYDSAMKELKEETGLYPRKPPLGIFMYTYTKSGVRKRLEVIVIREELSMVSDKLNGWTVRKDLYDTKEIHKAKFFPLEEAAMKLEPQQRDIIKRLTKYIHT